MPYNTLEKKRAYRRKYEKADRQRNPEKHRERAHKKIFDFIFWSSANPEKISLTLKGFVPFVLLFLGWANFGGAIDEAAADNFIAALVGALVKVGEVATAFITLYGAIRKIYLGSI